jgi:hypothetical protein
MIMSRTGKTKGLKKVVSLLVVICMVVALIPATLSFANTNDAVTAFNSIPEASRTAILAQLLDYALQEPTDGTTLDAAKAVTYVEQALTANGQGNLITKTPTPNDGKISEQTLTLIAEKVLQYKPIFLTYYTPLKGLFTEAQIKAQLHLSDTATTADIIKELEKIMVPLVKVNAAGTGFEKVANYDTALAAKIAPYDSAIQVAALGFSTLYSDKIVTKLNNAVTEYNFNVSDLATLLRAYNICEAAATTPTPTPSDNGGSNGSGGVIVTPTPTPTPSATPTPTSSTEIDKAVTDTVNNIGSAIKDIATLDTTKAVEKAVSIITAVQSLPLKSITLTQEKALEANVTALVQAVMSKVTGQTVTSTVSGTTATATISDASVADITAKIDTIIATADKLKAQIKDTKLDVTVPKVLEINVASDKSVDTAVVNIPAQLLNAAADKKIDSISLKTDVATISIAPQALGSVKDTVKVTASKVKAVPDAYKAAVGDSPVIDFSITVGDKAVTNFSKPVTVSIPYTLKAGEDQNKITVFYVKADGTLENVAGTYDPATKTVVFSTKHFSLYVIKTAAVSFNDVKAEDWFKDTVEVMASKGIIKGYADGSYLPQNKITRAEFASLLVRSFNLSDATAVNTFNDVKSADWFAADVAAAAKSGIVSGVGNGSFAPADNISRQDMAVMIARALQVVKNKSGAVISDTKTLFKDGSSIDSYAQSGVAVAAKYEIIKGLPDGNFAPTADATRAEAATMISRLFFLK